LKAIAKKMFAKCLMFSGQISFSLYLVVYAFREIEKIHSISGAQADGKTCRCCKAIGRFGANDLQLHQVYTRGVERSHCVE
jgi:hypothetical protein